MSERAVPLSPSQLRSFRRALLSWYDQKRRDLPWRRDRHPYRVWISEIMLQQTRVAAVLDHYARFLQRFPDVQALAAARESSVVALWSGLGYYHRARRMYRAAKIIARERGGMFPESAQEWLDLPGIGRYTAAAIASIAFGQAVAVVDGNVERILLRLFGEAAGREVAWQRAEALLDHKRPGDFNQAMMELGATICTPRAPQCLGCPINAFCITRGVETARPQAARKNKEARYAFARRRDSVLLVQRPPDASLMAGMWELPVSPVQTNSHDALLLQLRHSITDTDYRVSVYAMDADRFDGAPSAWRWFTPKQCERLALTGLTRKVLRRLTPESVRPSALSKMKG